jgi:hypothetical protein
MAPDRCGSLRTEHPFPSDRDGQRDVEHRSMSGMRGLPTARLSDTNFAVGPRERAACGWLLAEVRGRDGTANRLARKEADRFLAGM